MKFWKNKHLAPNFMEAHKNWLQDWVKNDIFLLAGSLWDKSGGAIIAHNIDKDSLENLLSQDPFVIEEIVTFEIIEISPSIISPWLSIK